MKTTAAKKISRTFLLMLMAGFMLLMLPSASSTKKATSQPPEKCFYLIRHHVGGPNSTETVPVFTPENRLQSHLDHGDTFILPNCISNIGELVR